MNFFSRLFGIFFNPGRTARAVADRPVWVDSLIVLLVLLALHSYIVFPYGQKESLAFLEGNAARLQEKWGEEGYHSAVETIKRRDRALMSFLVNPLTYLIGLLFSALIVQGMGGLVSTRGNYLQVFSPLLHASFVDKLLGNALRTFLVLSRESITQTSTSLTLFFPKMEAESTAYIILNQLDFFQIWLFGLFGIALTAAFKINVKKALLISFSFWLLKSLWTIGLTLFRLSAFK